MATATRIVDLSWRRLCLVSVPARLTPAIVALRSHTMDVLDSELEKVRNQFGCGAATEQFELAMRRMVKSLLHTPTVRAKKLASEGRAEDYAAGAGDPLRYSGGGVFRVSPPSSRHVFTRIFHASGGEYFISPRRSTAVHGADGRIHARVDAR